MEAASAAPARAHLIRHRSLLIDAAAIAIVMGLALFVRLITAGLFSSGISTDEYRYSIIAQEWLRIIDGTSSMSLATLIVHHPLVPVAAGIASAISRADPLVAGRFVQLHFNVGCVSLLYLLARSAGLRTAGAATSAIGLALMPGFWEASASFLPDSQLAFFSTLVLLGVMLGLRGSWWGDWVAAAAFGCGFLTKEHLPLVLGPSVAVLLAMALTTGLAKPGSIVRSILILATGLGIAIVLGAVGIGIPRAIVLSVLSDSSTVLPVMDNLPPAAPVLEAQAGSSWIASLLAAIANRAIGLEWFPEAFGMSVVSSAVSMLGLLGACVLLVARLPTSSNPVGLSRRAISIVCLVPLILLFLAQILISGLPGPLIGAVLLLVTFFVIASGRFNTRPVDHDWPRTGASEGERAAFWSLLAGLSTYVLLTVGFFALKLEQVSFLPRMFLPVMPVCALFFGLGCVSVGRVLRPFTDRLSAPLIVALGGALIGLFVPGGPIRKGGVVVAACLAGGALHWSGFGKLLPHTQTIAVLAAGLTLLVATPALTTLARGRDFRGYPTDPYYSTVTGGIRVATFRAAEPWLQANLRSNQSVITSKPYQVSWHGAIGFAGFERTRVWDERAVDRRRYLSDTILQNTTYDWIIDFNQFAVQPASPEGPLFEEDYRWLQSRPYLREAYTATDSQGRVMLYVFRHERS